MSRSNRQDRPLAESVTSKWPLKPEAKDTGAVENPSAEPRGKLRRPRDPRKKKNVRTRPPRRNPLMGASRSRATRTPMYDREDETYEEEE